MCCRVSWFSEKEQQVCYPICVTDDDRVPLINRPFSLFFRYWTGTSLQWRLERGNIIKRRLTSFTFEKIPRISLSCKLVPVQYREYQYGQLSVHKLKTVSLRQQIWITVGKRYTWLGEGGGGWRLGVEQLNEIKLTCKAEARISKAVSKFFDVVELTVAFLTTALSP